MFALASLRALPWKLIGGMAVVMAFALLWAAYKGEQRHSGKLTERVNELRFQLDDIATKAKAAQAATADEIAKAKGRIVIVERDAKRVETAPLPGGCKSPDAVMGADL